MNKNEILSQLETADIYVDKLSDILTSIEFDTKHFQAEIDIEEIKECLFEAANESINDIARIKHCHYENDPETREMLFCSLKEGCSIAFFWMATHFGDDVISFFEKNIGHQLRKLTPDEVDLTLIRDDPNEQHN